MGTKYYRHPQYGHVYGAEIVTPQGRFSWPSLVEPKDPPPPMEGQAPGNPRYEITLLIPKDSPGLAEFLGLLEPMVTDMLDIFNERRGAKITIAGNLLKDGDDQYWDKEKYPYYAGNWLLIARNTQQTKVCDRTKAIVDPVEIKGGQLGRLIVTPLITAHGLSFKLSLTQLVKDDGVRYGGSIADPMSFLSAIEDEGDAPQPVSMGTTPTALVARPKAVPAMVAKPVPAPTMAAPAAAKPAPAAAAGIRAQMAQTMSKGKKAALDKL